MGRGCDPGPGRARDPRPGPRDALPGPRIALPGPRIALPGPRIALPGAGRPTGRVPGRERNRAEPKGVLRRVRREALPRAPEGTYTPPAAPMLLDLRSFAETVVADYTYVGAFLILFLCGFGLPLPEEVTIIGSGILLHKGEVSFVPILVVCMAGVIAGDVIPFTLGRLYGPAAMQNRWIQRLIDKERYARMTRSFEKHGNWTTFSCRFFPGLRWPGYFVAGTMKMSYGRWFVLDLAGASLQVPVSLWLGVKFGEKIEDLERSVSNLHHILAFLVLAILLTIFTRARVMRLRRRWRIQEERERRREAHRRRQEAAARELPEGIPGPDATE